MDIQQLDIKRDVDIIIPRALYLTTKETFESDISRLESIYSTVQIITHLKNTKELISNEVCTLVAKRYSIPLFFRFQVK